MIDAERLIDADSEDLFLETNSRKIFSFKTYPPIYSRRLALKKEV